MAANRFSDHLIVVPSVFSGRTRARNAALNGDDLKEVIRILADKFTAAGCNDFLHALNEPFAKWTGQGLPEPKDIGRYMYAVLINSFDNPVDNLTGGYMYAWLIIRTVLIIRLTPLFIIRRCTSRAPRGTAVDNLHLIIWPMLTIRG